MTRHRHPGKYIYKCPKSGKLVQKTRPVHDLKKAVNLRHHREKREKVSKLMFTPISRKRAPLQYSNIAEEL